MPVMMKVLRVDSSPLRFCRSASFAKATWNSRWSLLDVAKYLLSQSCLRTALRTEAIGLPQIFDDADETLSISNNARICRRTNRGRSPLTSLCAALFVVMSYAVAGAQTATTTTLSVNPTSVTNVFAMTATINAGATPLTGGTVTFRDTYNTNTHVLGTVQVQSANGIKGNAVLQQELGIGAHSIVATFNAFTKPTAYLTSFSTAQNVTVTGLYPTTASLAQTGGSATSWSLTTTVVGTGSLTLSPTGNLTLFDTTNSNLYLGTAGLGSGTIGQQTVAGSNSPVTVGNNPQDVAAGDFDGDGFIDLAVLNANDKNISILKGDGSGGFAALTTNPAVGNGAVAIVTGDFNGDGKLDLAVANGSDGTVSILLGKGDGTFNAQVPYSLLILFLIPTAPTALAINDFNGDGIPDIAVSGTSLVGNLVAILQGNDTGAFTDVTPLGISVDTGPSSIVVGDFNGDDNLDFAVTNKSANSISVMLGGGNGTTFNQASGSPISTGSGTPIALVAADLNADGKLDLAVAESNKTR